NILIQQYEPMRTSTPLHTLSLHDALPIYIGGFPQLHPELRAPQRHFLHQVDTRGHDPAREVSPASFQRTEGGGGASGGRGAGSRSEEQTSELQSRFDLVCRLLLYKTKKK